MMGPDLLQRIDRAIRELVELREAVAGSPAGAGSRRKGSQYC